MTEEDDARRIKRGVLTHDVVITGRIATALTGCRNEASPNGFAEIHEHGCIHTRLA